MAVLKLVPRDNSDTIHLFERLAAEARAGRLHCAVVCVQRPDRTEEVFFSGRCKAHPDQGAAAALRASIALAQANGDYDTYPS